MSNTALHTYAEAYVQSIPNDRDAVKEFDSCLAQILAAKEIHSFLGDVSVPIAKRREALTVAFPKAADATINFLTLLAKDGQIDRLESLSDHIRTAVAAKAGKRHATVTSAVPLTAKDLSRIEHAVAKVIGHDVHLEERTDATLGTGFSVTVDGWTFDASLKAKLNRLQHALTSSPTL